MKHFKNKVAVITGAGSGIGQALAIELAGKGCHLALSDVNQKGLLKTKSIIDSGPSGANVKTYILDVADKSLFFDHAKQVSEDFGHINLLVNNAGVALSAKLDEVKREDFDWLMNINFWGVVNGTEAFLP